MLILNNTRTSQRLHEKEKLQANLIHEHECKNHFKQNNSKSNPRIQNKRYCIITKLYFFQECKCYSTLKIHSIISTHKKIHLIKFHNHSIKTLIKLGIEGKVSNLRKSSCEGFPGRLSKGSWVHEDRPLCVHFFGFGIGTTWLISQHLLWPIRWCGSTGILLHSWQEDKLVPHRLETATYMIKLYRKQGCLTQISR